MRVLLVEDDENFAKSLIHFLELQDICCDFANNGELAITLLKQGRFDVIISDVNMPKMDGLSLCASFRQQGGDTPIILLTALADIDNKLAGFDAGADDYLTKPFELRELLARVKNLAKRKSGNTQYLVIDELNLELKLDEHVAYRESQPLELTPTNWRLLEAMVRAYPKLLCKSDLEHIIWGDHIPDNSSVKVHIHRLRERLDKPFSKPIIFIEKGVGAGLKVRTRGK